MTIVAPNVLCTVYIVVLPSSPSDMGRLETRFYVSNSTYLIGALLVSHVAAHTPDSYLSPCTMNEEGKEGEEEHYLG